MTGDWIAQHGIQLSVLRLDQTHDVVSGNKLFKLRYFLQKAAINAPAPLVTFGGAFSNHLAAAAYACAVENIPCIGIVRGEAPKILSHTLQQCLGYGMQLKFIARQQYAEKDSTAFIQQLQQQYPGCCIVPEGGYAPEGAKGAAAIMQYIAPNTTHICCAVGTATTLAGLITQLQPSQALLGFAALKGMTDIYSRVLQVTDGKAPVAQLVLQLDYHFGGYAKHTPALIEHMNHLWEQHQLPTDFVYTGKMMYGVLDLIRQGYFPTGSRIVCIHTGGLQGNLSLPANTLTF